jgi:hypothetical protein
MMACKDERDGGNTRLRVGASGVVDCPGAEGKGEEGKGDRRQEAGPKVSGG